MMKWITEKRQIKNKYTDYVRDFESDGTSAKIEICSAGEYVLYLNGNFIGCGQYNSYPEKKYRDEYTVKTVKGLNRLAITGYMPGCDTCTELADDRGVAFSVRVGDKTYYSDKNTLCRLSERYFSGDTTLIVGNIGYNVFCDLTKDDEFYMPGKQLFDFSYSEEKGDAKTLSRPTKMLEILPPENGRLSAAGLFFYDEGTTDSQKMQNAYLSAKRLAYFGSEEKYPYRINCDTDKGVYLLFDLGKESTGYFYLDAEFEEDCDAEYCWGEQTDDLRVRAEISGRNFSGKVRLKAGRNSYTEYFSRLGLRYLMLFVHGGKFTVYGAGIRPCYYPVKTRSFRVKDALAQKIFDVSADTLKLCMHEHYEDCPWREQSQYVMDSRNQILSGFYAFDNPEFVRASLLLASDRINDDGNIPLMQPSDFCLVIPNFTLCYLLTVKDYYEYTKDLSFVKEVFPRLKKIITSFEKKIDEKGLLNIDNDERIWNFFEWNDNMINAFGDNPIKENEKRYAFPNQAFMILALESYAYLASLSGEGGEKEAALSEKIKTCADKVFYDEENTAYSTYISNGARQKHFSEYVQALAVYAGIAREDRREGLAKKLVAFRSGKSGAKLVPASLSNLFYVYEALLSCGEKYCSVVREDIKKIWGKMLFSGATSFYEVEEGAEAFYHAGSLCHGWSAVPAYFYGKYGLEK